MKQCFIDLLQLRESVFQFTQKELAPKAAQIDKENNFADMKVENVVLISYKNEW